MSPNEAMLAELRRIRLAVESAAKPRPRLFTAKQAARELGIGITKFMLMISANEVRRVKVGAALMVPASEIDRLASLPAERTAAPKQPRSTGRYDAKAEYEKAMKRLGGRR